MAIDRTGITSLDAGAGDITYSGNQGPKSPDQQLMAQADPMIVEMYQQYVFEMEEQGMQPVSFKQFLQQIMSESRMSQGESANPTYSQRRKQRMAYGGIAGVDGRKRYGIGSWFQGVKDKFVDDIIPNEIKENPILSSVAAGALLNQFGIPFTGTPGDRMGQNWLGDLLGGKDLVLGPGGEGTVSNNPAFGGIESLGKTVAGAGGGGEPLDIEKWLRTSGNVLTGGGINPTGRSSALQKIAGIIPDEVPKDDPGFWTKLGQTLVPGGEKGFGDLYGTLFGPSTYGEGENAQTINWKTPLAIGMSMGALDKATRKDESLPAQPGIDIADISSRALTGSDPDLRFLPPASATTAYAQGGRIGYAGGGTWGIDTAREEWNKLGINSKLGYEDFVDFFLNGPWGSNQYRTGSDKLAQGGRVAAQEGGLMDLGGMEKDYRQEGGFVPIGGQERADDVPARLSKNEFVFTADAVRSAGGGDIDKGAEVMENVMNNLEQGGQISQESQGLEGARNMFATAQRLEGVL